MAHLPKDIEIGVRGRSQVEVTQTECPSKAHWPDDVFDSMILLSLYACDLDYGQCLLFEGARCLRHLKNSSQKNSLNEGISLQFVGLLMHVGLEHASCIMRHA